MQSTNILKQEFFNFQKFEAKISAYSNRLLEVFLSKDIIASF